MSISPVSDIVLDVAKAADPAKFRAAVERLSSSRAARTAQSGPFALALRIAAADFSTITGLSGSAVSKPMPKADARNKAYSGLEQLVLKTLVESMLPKESPALFGSGTAGDMWRSMLADQLAGGIGKSLDLGTAHQKKLAAYPIATEKSHP